MSTSRHIDKICIAVVAVALAITIVFMCGERIGITVATRTVKYEQTLFDTSYVHKIDIVMDDWDSFIETCENEEYSMCTVVADGQKHSNVAIRAKGNTSLSSVKTSGTNRYSFKLEFDRYETGKTLDGLDKLCLNNLIQDNTMMKDYLVYRMMDDFGADSPLCSFAYITVNGEDWGLYLAVEGVEDSFLSRNYGSDTGELYKPDSLSFGGGRGNGKGFNMDDFDFGGSETQEQGSNEQNGNKTEAPDEEIASTAPQTPNGSNAPGGSPPSGGVPGSEGSEGGQDNFPFGGSFPGEAPEDGEQGGFPFGGSFPGMGSEEDGQGNFPFGGSFPGMGSEEDGQGNFPFDGSFPGEAPEDGEQGGFAFNGEVPETPGSSGKEGFSFGG
ncbi:MAG: CotH kinase family protein, partial [Clostridia bacterium]|nr:CotH kinase family protein [Clostridia bacterium]